MLLNLLLIVMVNCSSELKRYLRLPGDLEIWNAQVRLCAGNISFGGIYTPI
jgi:hypothetical protein